MGPRDSKCWNGIEPEGELNMDQRVNDDLLLIDYFLSDDFLLQEELKDIGMVVRKTKKKFKNK